MSKSLASTHPKERWEVGDQLWSRDPTTGAFDLADYKGLGIPPPACDPLDLAMLVGARVSTDGPDRGAWPFALYPGAFKFSPITGKPLPEPSTAGQEAWLPPFGDDASKGEHPQGLRLTTNRLALRPTLGVESPADRQLAVPPAGNYQFVVGMFGASEARLLALEFARGLIYHWLPHAAKWLAVEASGVVVLPESSLGESAWGMAVQDPEGSTKLFMPTDEGLAIVSINLIAQTYEARTVGKRCVGAPVLWQGRVYVPMLDEDRRLGIFSLDPQGNAFRRVRGPDIDVPATEWARPLADRREIIWMSAKGQLIVKRRGDGAFEASLLPWGPGITPRFELGSPYLSDDGGLWQQCLRHDERRGDRFVFVQLGAADPEIRPASSARLCTGAACFHQDTRLEGEPWFDPDEGLAPGAEELVFPLLESTSASTVLCARVPTMRSADRVFASIETFTTTFELLGEYGVVQFWEARMPRPWATRAFVYAGHLYLYHPDKRRLPGWRIGT